MGNTKVMQTRVAGVNYEGRQEYVARLNDNTKVMLKREKNNPYDENAVGVCAVFDEGIRKIGYLPRDLARDISKFLDDGKFVFVDLMGVQKEEYSYKDTDMVAINEWDFLGVRIGLMY